MLGFVNGRSCAHKSKPRGLILCFYDFGCKGTENFLISAGILPESYKKMHPTKIECKISKIF
jgi:hypothetical protein